MFAIYSVKVLIVLAVFFMTSDAEDDCNLIDEVYKYLKALLENFVKPKILLIDDVAYRRYLQYRNIDCLQFFVYENNSACDVTTFALSLKTHSCQQVREKYKKDSSDAEILKILTLTQSDSNFENVLATLDSNLDTDDLCSLMHDLMGKPSSAKSKQEYVKLYTATGKLFPRAFVESLGYPYLITGYAGIFCQCILEIGKEAEEYFKNLQQV